MYLSDQQLRDRLDISARQWPRVLTAFEREGMPGKDPVVGKRYWPAIEKWLMQRHDAAYQPPADTEKETWDAIRQNPRS